MTRIWLVNWHFQSRITLWCRHKLTNVSMGLCWQMPKFIVWHLWSIYFDHYLPLKPSIGKRRKQSCIPKYVMLYRYRYIKHIHRCTNDTYVYVHIHIVIYNDIRELRYVCRIYRKLIENLSSIVYYV